MDLQPNHLAAATLLLALVPVALYVVNRPLFTAIALVNVVLIAGCLYYMFGPSEGERAHAPA